MAEMFAGIVDKARDCFKDSTGFVLVIAGNAATTAIVEAVRTWAPEWTEGVADETIAAVVGFIVFNWGDRIHERLTPFGFGMFIAGTGAWASAWVAPLFAMLKKAG